MRKKLPRKSSIIILSIVVLVAIIAVAYFSGDKQSNSINADVTVQAATYNGTMTMSPTTNTVILGNNLNLQLMLNTGGQQIIDYTMVINYDSTKLQPVNTSAPVTPGSLLSAPDTWNTIETPGRIRYEQTALSPYSNTTAALAGTLVLKSISTTGGTATPITFTFTGQGASGDSDIVIKGGSDILASVTNASANITINNFSTTITNRINQTTCPSVTTGSTLNIKNGAALVATSPITLATNCIITPTTNVNIPGGTYTLEFIISGMLKKTVAGVVLPSATPTIAIPALIQGNLTTTGAADCINLYDYVQLKTKWGMTGLTGGDILYDLNGDGFVGGMDWGVMYDAWNTGSICI